MLQINLLPWREQARLAKKIRFLITLGIFVFLTLFLIFIVHCYLATLISYQIDRNNFLQSQLDKNQAELVISKAKKKQEVAMEDQLNFLKNLRGKSYRAVSLLNSLTTTVPTGLSVEKITRDGNTITLEGSAQSDLEITLFLKNISNTSGFAQPELSGINTDTSATGETRHFTVKVQQQDRQPS